MIWQNSEEKQKTHQKLCLTTQQCRAMRVSLVSAWLRVFLCSHWKACLVFTSQSVVTRGDALEGVNNTSPEIWVDLRKSRFPSKNKGSLSLVQWESSWLHFCFSKFFPKQTTDFSRIYHSKHGPFRDGSSERQPVVWGLLSVRAAPLPHNVLHILLPTYPHRSSSPLHVSLQRWQGAVVNKLSGFLSIPLQRSFSEVENTRAFTHMHTKLVRGEVLPNATWMWLKDPGPDGTHNKMLGLTAYFLRKGSILVLKKKKKKKWPQEVEIAVYCISI